MFPVFFGPTDDPLYGVCHPAEPAVARPLGAVICQPILHESDDAHRALRSLAEQLAAAGIHVLRFDYHGTGDSSGDAESASVARWADDVLLAMQELRDSRGLSSVGLVGLRFGATLAAQVAAQVAAQGPTRADAQVDAQVEPQRAQPKPAASADARASASADASTDGAEPLPFLVLWEPVVRGDAYATSLRELHAAWLAHESRERPGAPRFSTPHEVVGFPFTPELSAGLESVDLLSGPAPRAERALIVDEGAAGDDAALLATRLAGSVGAFEHQRVDGGTVWRREFDGEQRQVPRQLLAQIVEWIAREDAV